jgi:hypothetical protein
MRPEQAPALRRFLAWLVAAKLEQLALANQARHKSHDPIPIS